MNLYSSAVPPRDDSVSISVEIAPHTVPPTPGTPAPGDCIASCAVEPVAPPLPVTGGGEPVSLLLPAALLVTGMAAMLYSRWKNARADR